MTDVYTAALHLTKPASEDDSGFKQVFGTDTSLPPIHRAPAVTQDTARLCWIDVTQWDCHIHADAVKALSWIFLMSDGESPRFVKNTKVMKLRHYLDKKYIGYPAILYIGHIYI